jgi:2-dehydro-3-deoxyphosphooctonate aldolase (KDO 8-P synthase)
MKVVKIGNISVANNLPFILIAGPCALESRDVAFRCAESLIKTTDELNIPFIFKSSFDKANRTSLNARRGVPMKQALKIFEEIKKAFGCLIITDVHESWQCQEVADVVDVLQIPAFLCRQTDLLVAAAKTGKAVEIKKGQFLAPWDMENVYKKVTMSGNENVLLCERGSCFGYNRLVSDMRSLKIMGDYGYPVIFDATHSVQEPGGLGGSSGGNRDYVELLARAAMSIGVAGLYIETHFDPKNAFSDGPNMVPLHVVKDFLITMKKFDEVAKSTPYQDMSC